MRTTVSTKKITTSATQEAGHDEVLAALAAVHVGVAGAVVGHHAHPASIRATSWSTGNAANNAAR